MHIRTKNNVITISVNFDEGQALLKAGVEELGEELHQQLTEALSQAMAPRHVRYCEFCLAIGQECRGHK